MNNLNRNELEVLRVLWEGGESKPAEIEAAFGWAIDNGTLRSVLRVLMEKGHVTRQKSGKVYFYKAKRTRKGVLAKTARAMADAFAGGSRVGLIAQLIEAEKLSPEELDVLRQIAEKNTGQAGKKTGKGKKP